MARNEEKAQSMLYRFREAKAMEMGLVSRNDRRPRLASFCKDLKQCERWRGEILREISRKVTKIQDYGLTDYEVRDLNDEINKLMREKGHWETQIAALGGANYHRAAGSIRGSDGSEIMGASGRGGRRGYKYFGRAKELPGVKELFETSKKDEEGAATSKRQNFANLRNVGPDYYGDLGEETEELLRKAEREAEEEEWQDAIADVADSLGLDTETLTLEPMPVPDYVSLPGPSAPSTSAQTQQTDSSSEIPPPPPPFPGTEGAGDEDADADMASTEAAADVPVQATGSKRKAEADAAGEEEDVSGKAARTDTATAGSVNRIFTVLRKEDLVAPQLPSLEELEKFLVDKQKQELLSEYA